jgi:hypothetical protein
MPFLRGHIHARDRLFLYAPTEKTNGHNRPLSPFLDGVGGHFPSRRVHIDDALSLKVTDIVVSSKSL